MDESSVIRARCCPFWNAVSTSNGAGMAAVPNDGTGTAYRASQLGLGDTQMAGKTGTAQSRDYGTGSRGPRDAVWTRRDHALFVAFAPHDAHRMGT